MGTNYYWHSPANTCPTCGRSDAEELHIGKSSAGWCFALRVYPNREINDLPDWIDRFEMPGSRIVDEYGRDLAPSDMLLAILVRFRRGDPPDPIWLVENHARRGPFGLARACQAVAGDGPYDLCDYEFC